MHSACLLCSEMPDLSRCSHFACRFEESNIEGLIGEIGTWIGNGGLSLVARENKWEIPCGSKSRQRALSCTWPPQSPGLRRPTQSPPPPSSPRRAARRGLARACTLATPAACSYAPRAGRSPACARWPRSSQQLTEYKRMRKGYWRDKGYFCLFTILQKCFHFF